MRSDYEMSEYFLATFHPGNVKSTYFRGGVGYKAGTDWVFKDYVPHSIEECPNITVESIDEEQAMEFINKGVIYNDYLVGEQPIAPTGGRYSHLEVDSPTPKTSSAIEEGGLKELEDSIIARLSTIIEKTMNGRALDQKEQEVMNDFDGEIDLDKIRAELYSPDTSLSHNSSKFGEIKEQESSSVDDAAALLRQTKDTKSQSPNPKPQNTVIEENIVKKDVVEDKIDELEEVTLPELPNKLSDNADISPEPIRQSKKKKNRLNRISEMLQELKVEQESEKS